jgi:ABC-2 type transport system permease protein
MLAAARPGPGLWFWRVLLAFARREARTAAGYRVSVLVRGLGFCFSLLTLAFLARLVGASSNPHLVAYGGDYLAFAVVGLIVMDLQQVGVTNLSNRVRMAQVMGVMEAELATPVPAWMALGVGPVYEFALAILRVSVYVALASVVFGVHFPHASWPSLALTFPLLVAAFGGLGLLSGAVTMLVRRTNPVAALLGGASLLLSGVAYPVSVLPPALRWVGNLLPLTHALVAARGALLLGASPGALARPLLALGGFAAVLVPSGAWLFWLALRYARRDGSLTHF